MFAAFFPFKNVRPNSLSDVSLAFERGLFPFDKKRPDTQEITKNSIAVKADDVHCHSGSSRQILFWGRLDNHGELSESLGAGGSKDPCPAELIALAWDKWGEEFAIHLVGDFAIVIFFAQMNKVVLVRDAIGIRPLFYLNDPDHVICATSPNAILESTPKRLKKNKAWVARFLVDETEAAFAEKTAYDGLLKVTPGHIVVLVDSKIQTNQQWKKWNDAAPYARVRDQKWVEQHRALFFKAVERCSDTGVIGAESSAGIDSSSIIATLCQQLAPNQKDRVICFGMVDTALTETLIQELSAVNGGLETPILRTDEIKVLDYDQELETELAVMGYPIGHTSYVRGDLLSHYHTERGMNVVLSGFGGDEVVTNFARLFITELIDQRDWRNLYDIQRGNVLTKTLRAMRYVWLDIFGRRTKKDRVDPKVLEDSIANAETIKNYGLERFIAGTGGVNREFHTVNAEIIQSVLINPNIANRIECHMIFGKAFGVEYRWPLFDAQLVQNYLETPSIEKYGPNASLRYLHKRAMDGIVPDSINWRQNKHLGPNFAMDEGLFLSLLKDAQKAMDTLHPDLMEFIEFDKIQAKLSAFSQARKQTAEAEAFVDSLYRLVALNYWFHHGH